MTIKENLLHQCNKFVNNRLKTITKIISSNKNALQSETKSSAGDKHETGRAMLQLEMEKAGQQLTSVNDMKFTLEKINTNEFSQNAHLGSIVYTNKINYFLSISVGKIIVGNESFFAVSISSPIGKLLLGKTENEKIIFNENSIIITKII